MLPHFLRGTLLVSHRGNDDTEQSHDKNSYQECLAALESVYKRATEILNEKQKLNSEFVQCGFGCTSPVCDRSELIIWLGVNCNAVARSLKLM